MRQRPTLGTKTIADCVAALIANRKSIMARQDQIEAAIPGPHRSSRNRTCNTGWANTGNAAWTQAVIRSGLPHQDYWSGSNPTPSTQYPLAIAEFLEVFCFGEEGSHWWRDDVANILKVVA